MKFFIRKSAYDGSHRAWVGLPPHLLGVDVPEGVTIVTYIQTCVATATSHRACVKAAKRAVSAILDKLDAT